MGFRGGGGGSSAHLELCTAVLLLCWLCCGPHQRHESSSRRRSGEVFSRRIGSSAISLHLPSTSGRSKQPLSAHRSHEEIPSRRKSTNEARYHSAPSVIDEVLRRRDWERSSKDLYIPLRPPDADVHSDDSSPEHAPCAEPESSSVECLEQPKGEVKKCKKHHTNIKSSKNRCKESNKDDIKDTDATEVPNFYIGDAKDESLPNNDTREFRDYDRLCEPRNNKTSKGKGDKQSLNECIKLKARPLEGDRSGAVHHTVESRISFGPPDPPPSVETVGYDEGACYLAESGSPGSGRGRPRGLARWPRDRHASDGDILAPAFRPESGAFSESDLDIDLESCDERPPPYHAETAI